MATVSYALLSALVTVTLLLSIVALRETTTASFLDSTSAFAAGACDGGGGSACRGPFSQVP